MADFLQPVGLMGQSNITAPGLGKLGDIMTGAQAVNTQLQSGFNLDTKRQFANKVQQAINGVPAYIIDPRTGEDVPNPAYANALKPLALQAYHAQVQTGDNTLMDDLNTLIKTQQSASGRGNIDWAGAQAIESQYNAFRTELEGLQERKTTLSADEKARYEKLYNDFLTLDSQYNQITQGKRLPYKGRTDQFNANTARLQEAQANVAEYGVAEAQDKAIKDVTDTIKESLADWANTNKEKLSSLSKWQNFREAFDIIKQNSSESIATSPALTIGLVKAVNKMIEPDAAVMADDVNTMTGTSGGSSVVDNLLKIITQMMAVLKIGSNTPVPEAMTNAKTAVMTRANIDKIKSLGESFLTVGKTANDLINKSYSGLGQSLLNLAQTRSANRLAMTKDANGNPLDVKTWANTEVGQGALKALVSSKIPAAQVAGEVKNLLGGADTMVDSAPETKTTQMPKVSPSEYSRILLPAPADVSGDFTTAKANTIEWLNGALTAFNSATDSKLRMKQRSAIVAEYNAAEAEYDMPQEIDSAVKAIQVQEAPNPTKQIVAPAKTTSSAKSSAKTKKKPVPAPVKVERKSTKGREE